MNRPLSTLALIATLAALGARSALPQGVNLGWNACGPAGVALKSFACDSNAGSHVAVGSYIAPAGITQLNGMEITLDLCSAAAQLPDWWLFLNAGSCRQTSLGLNFIYTGADCLDYWAFVGPAVGGIAAYRVGYPGANGARILAVGAVPSDVASTVAAGEEYFAFNLTINNAKTVGTGACAGCGAPACLVLSRIRLTQPLGVGDFTLDSPGFRQFIAWQGPCQSYGCYVPALNRTFGQIKAMYR